MEVLDLEKTNALLNLINHEPGINKICLYDEDPYERKYQFLINKRESTGLKYLIDSKAFIEYSNDMDDLYKNIEEYNPIFKNISFRIFEHEVWFTDQNSNPLEIEDKIDHFSYSLKYNI